MRRLVFCALALALALALMPGMASAAQATKFTASGNICLVSLPTSVSVKPTPTGMWLTASGEVLGGSITSSPDWPDLVGAEVTVTVTQEKSFFSFITGTFAGRLKAEFTIATAAPLQGELKGVVSGAFSDPYTLPDSIYSSSATVRWEAESDDAEAKGVANASFAVTEVGYCGPITFSGTYKPAE